MPPLPVVTQYGFYYFSQKQFIAGHKLKTNDY